MMLLEEQIVRIRQLFGLSEAVVKPHFIDRVFDRLKSQFSTFSTESEKIQETVSANIKELAKISFPGQHNIGVLVFKSPKDYVYHRVVNGKVEHSEGAFIWAVIRGNELETLVFGDSNYKPKNTQYAFTLKKLTDYIATSGSYEITEKDLHKLTLKPTAAAPTTPKEPAQVVVINGSKWVVDTKNSVMYQKNNPSKTANIYDVIDNLEPSVQNQIMAMVA
jgi:hypothetical protein